MPIQTPALGITAAAALLCATFIGLGRWQWERGEQRDVQRTSFATGAQSILPLGSRKPDELPQFQNVSLTGRYDAAHQFLLENRSYAGRPGYEVLTPFELTDGRVLLVNRGWIPFTGFRERLPDIAFEAPQSLTVVGRLGELPTAGLASGRSAPDRETGWPKLTSFPDMAALSAALARPLESRILLLDPKAPHGYVRDWQPPGMSPERHWAYAFQWWGLAALTFVLWVLAAMHRTKRAQRHE